MTTSGGRERKEEVQKGEKKEQQDIKAEEVDRGEKHMAGVKRRGSGGPWPHSLTVGRLEGLSHLYQQCASAFQFKLCLRGTEIHTSTDKHSAQSDPCR